MRSSSSSTLAIRRVPPATTAASTGKSSGGYGAMVVPMLRPDVFGALASHAGDALFECCYRPDFPAAARILRDEYDGSFETFIERFEEADRFSFDKQGKLIEMYGYALAYSPDPDRPGKPLIPFDTDTGEVVEEVWEKWLDLDPVRMAPRHGDALTSMRRIYLDAGKATSGTSTSARPPSPASSARSAPSTPSSSSTASTAA